MSIQDKLDDLNNALLDLQQADYNTFARPLQRMARALGSDDLAPYVGPLLENVDFDAFVDSSNRVGGMAGSERLEWPDDPKLEMGLIIELIKRGAEDENWFTNFTHRFFYSGTKIVSSIRKATTAALIPFVRDFDAYVRKEATPQPKDRPSMTSQDLEKVFVVHGHEDGPKEAVARFLEKLGLTPVILHEQASRGMTIPEKLYAYSNVGFAVVLLTPDDLGRSKSEVEEKQRARQNVILELGYFIGHLGRDRVLGLLKGGLEIPSDYVGVVYTQIDDAGAWRMELAKELSAAGYEIDFNVVVQSLG